MQVGRQKRGLARSLAIADPAWQKGAMSRVHASARRPVCLRRRLSSAAGLAFAWSLVVLALRPAGAAPHLDRRQERAIVDGVKVASPVRSDGTWQASAEGVRLTATGPGRQAHWLAEAAGVGDGFVRFRLRGARPKHLGLWVRAQAHKGEVARVNGYHLAVRGDALVWMRSDRGVLRSLGAETKIKGLSRRSALEVAVWMIGPHLAAEAFDGDSLEALGSVSVSDGAFASGGVGWMQFTRTGTPVALQWLGARDAAAAPGAATQQGESIRQGDARGGGGPAAPAGPWRYFAMGRDAVARLPAHLRARVRSLEPWAASAGEVWVRADRMVAEQLFRLALVRDALPVDTPYMAVAPSMVRRGEAATVDQAHYGDAAAVAATLRALHRSAPGSELLRIGRSRLGHDLWALHLPGSSPDALPVLLNGGHHGDELVSVTQTLDAARQLIAAKDDDPELAAWAAQLDLWIVALVNPDGVDTFLTRSGYAGRKNGRDIDQDGQVEVDEGVDLNRNYPFRWGALGEGGSSASPWSPYFRGDRPGSEPETQAMMRLVEAIRPVASISYHTLGTVVLWPYTTDGVADSGAALTRSVAETVARAAPRQPNRKRFRVLQKIYPVDGVDQDWMRAAHGTVALLIEGPGQNPTSAAQLQAEIHAVRPTWRALLQRVATGPRLVGRILGPDGLPVVAEVVVEGDEPLVGERWTSRCSDGRVFRLLPDGQARTVQLRAGGQELGVIEVRPDGDGLASFEHRATATGLAHSDCPDAALCSVEAGCLAKASACVDLRRTPTTCRIGDRCDAAAGPGVAGCACRPELDAFAWTEPGGRRCGPAAGG